MTVEDVVRACGLVLLGVSAVVVKAHGSSDAKAIKNAVIHPRTINMDLVNAQQEHLIVGILAGLFSSVCLAGPIWNLLKKVGKKK